MVLIIMFCGSWFLCSSVFFVLCYLYGSCSRVFLFGVCVCSVCFVYLSACLSLCLSVSFILFFFLQIDCGASSLRSSSVGR